MSALYKNARHERLRQAAIAAAEILIGTCYYGTLYLEFDGLKIDLRHDWTPGECGQAGHETIETRITETKYHDSKEER